MSTTACRHIHPSHVLYRAHDRIVYRYRAACPSVPSPPYHTHARRQHTTCLIDLRFRATTIVYILSSCVCLGIRERTRAHRNWNSTHPVEKLQVQTSIGKKKMYDILSNKRYNAINDIETLSLGCVNVR